MKNIFQEVTDKIIEKLKQGVIPWKQTWNTNLPMNYVTKKNYRGINVFILGMQGYNSNLWASFKQISKAGGKIKKGEKATLVVFWKMIKVSVDEDDNPILKPVIRYYYVFNIEQCENIELPVIYVRKTKPIAKCEHIISGMPLLPSIMFKGSSAFYNPSKDYIQIPKQSDFVTDASFYETLFHEIVHSTGHNSRLNRTEVTNNTFFGSHDYSKEELIAEMGASFLCANAGIDNITLNNSVAYIQSWLKKLENDNKLLIQAAGKAQKAVDFILNTKFKN